MDHQLVAVVWVLSALIVAMAVGWLSYPECDPACDHCKAKRQENDGKRSGQWCLQHGQPRHECRDQHRS